MSDRRKPPGDDIADANSLFDDDDDDVVPTWEGMPSHTRRPKPAKTPATPPPAALPPGEYAVEGVEPDDDPPPLPRAPIQPPRASAPDAPKERAPRAPIRETSRRAEDDDSDEFATSSSESSVEEVWTRWGEWGPTLTTMGIVATVVVVGSYWAANAIGFGTGLLLFVLGLAVLVLLSYPIAVTLERPVRMTPEQAVKDYFAAASHHFPQYRRMWLLLSDDGKDCAEFDSYATFRAYWVRTMARIRDGRIKKSTPLAFAIREFHSDKSAGQTVIEADYTVAVRARDAAGGATQEYPVVSSFVRGPDKMWYLNSGVLPEAAPASREHKPMR